MDRREFIIKSSLASAFLLAGCRPNNNGDELPEPDSDFKADIELEGTMHSEASFHEELAKILEELYQSWEDKYVAPTTVTLENKEGKLEERDALRVVNKDGITVSEGMGYGMLFAAYRGDKQTFDQLLNFTLAHLHPDYNLMSYKISKNGEVAEGGQGSATDADQDIAFALITMYQQTGEERYKELAIKMLDALYNNAVDKETGAFLPWRYGNIEELNPSYFDPALYRVFAQFTGNSGWLKVADASYQAIENFQHQNSDFAHTGLFPEYLNYDGHVLWDKSGGRYSYNAVRVPLRLMRDALWYDNSKAIEILTNFNATMEGLGPSDIRSDLELDGTADPQIMHWNNSPFLAPAVAASILSEDSTYQEQIVNKLLEKMNTDPQYYGDALSIWALMLLEGSMTNPLPD